MQRDISIDRLRARALRYPHDPAYFSYIDGQWVATEWREYHKKVRLFGKALLSLGMKSSDKVAILGFNKLEWLIACMGTQYAGGISVGVYTSSSAEEVSYVVDHCDAEILVVENLERYNSQVKKYINNLKKIKLIVLMSGEISEEENIINFKNFLAKASSIPDSDLNERQNSIKPDDTATMIYTSGTTGNPKSVMLSHNTIAWTVRNILQAWECTNSDRALSYLPLAHVAEQMITIYAPIDCGLQSYFATSLGDFAKNLTHVEPTVLFGVPRVYEKIYEAIKRKISEQNKLSQSLFKYFTNVSRAYYDAHHQSKEAGLLISVKHMIGRRKIFSQIKNKMGLGKTRICACGAAPISVEILNFFGGLDLPIYEVFGQSENCGPTTINLPGAAKVGTVGRPLLGAEIRIAEDGEILIKGPHVFQGYYKDQKASEEVLKDGWLYSGDIGSLDGNNYLSITDRKKDLLITAGGKNISPQNLESMLKLLPYVQSAVVVGDSKKYLCALLAPDKEALSKKAESLGLGFEQVLEHNLVLKEIQTQLALMNQKLAPVEQIKKIALLSHEFSIESGELTPTLKVKRKFVNQKYQDQIDKLYLEPAASF